MARRWLPALRSRGPFRCRKNSPMLFRRSPIYEPVANIPLLIYAPGIAPRTSDALVSLVDIFPTLLDFCGVRIPDAVQGRSLVPILEGREDTGREYTVDLLAALQCR